MVNHYNYFSQYSSSTTNSGSYYSFSWNLRPGQTILIYGDAYTVNYVDGGRVHFLETDNYIEIYGAAKWRWVEPNKDFEPVSEEVLVALLGG